jgi:hypothetical protein
MNAHISTSMAIQQAVKASPGITLRQIAAALGIAPRAKITSISARLSQLVEFGKLRRDEDGRRHNPARYWPTPTTCVDLRELRRKPGDPVQRKIAGQRARRQAKAAAAPASPKARKPAPASYIRVANPPPPPKIHYAGNRTETVEQFQARGGRVQVLGPHDSGNPLRFDHSHAGTPLLRRRGAVHPRRHGAP